MKKVSLFFVFLLAGTLSFPGLTAQEQESDLVKLQKQEEERKKKLKQPGKVITNSDLEKYAVPKKKSAAVKNSAATTSKTTKSTKKTGKNKPSPVPRKKVVKPDPQQTREYWQHLKEKIETKLAEIKEQVEKDQLELNRLQTEFLGTTLPMQQADLRTQIAELTRKLDTNKMRLKNIQEEYDTLPEKARKAGVPPGWVR